MASAPYIVDATPENFPELVLENPGKEPVVGNYRAPRAGPCLKLRPVLERSFQHYQRHFLRVHVNLGQQYRGLLESTLF